MTDTDRYVRRRRLPVHDFTPHPSVKAYSYCTYPDPGNAVSGICGMTATWHTRDHEERAAEAADGNPSDDLTGDLDPVDVASTVHRIFKPVSYTEAKAAARAVVSRIDGRGSDVIPVDDIVQSAAFELLKRWSEQDF